MPEIVHEIKIAAAPEQVYAALATLDGIRSWQTPNAQGSGEVGTDWVFAFANRPRFVWTIAGATPPSHLEWTCAEGPGDSGGTTATWIIEPLDDGRTLLTLRHTGWPGTHGNFTKCNTIWGVLLHHIQQYVETNEPATAFD